MGRKPNKRPSFVKVLIFTDFTHLLRLPPLFLKKHGFTLPENVKLRISSGKIWNVKVEQKENGPFCFTKGWEIFAEDAKLKFGEFLVFTFDCKSNIFDVGVYETSACEREFPARSFKVDDSDSDEDHVQMSKHECKTKNRVARHVINKRGPKARKYGGASKFRQSLEESNTLYFELHLKIHHRSRISLAKRFATAAGLIGKTTVGLKYGSKQRYHSVVLDHRPNSYRLDMARGWSEFRTMNGLEYAKMYSFEFKPGENVIHVQEVKEED